MRIVAIAVMALAILIGVFIYDKTRSDRLKKMMAALKKLHGGDITTTKAIPRTALVAAFPCSSTVFNVTLTRLRDEDYIIMEKDKIKFTPWGKKFYETKIENVRG